MKNERILHGILALALLCLGVVVNIFPDPVGEAFRMCLWPLFLTLLASMISGPFFGSAVGFFLPLITFLLFRKSPFFPATFVSMFSNGIAGFAAGTIYLQYETAVGASLIGRLISMLSEGLLSFFLSFPMGQVYSLGTFLQNTIVEVIPGCILILTLLPLTIVGLRKINFMSIVRGERKKMKV